MKEADDISLYIHYYKKGEIPVDKPIYRNLMAGNNNRPLPDRFIGDDTGDHISHKNKYYSELTGIYWVWKNTKHNTIGSCHYRRYFTAEREPLFYRLKRFSYRFANLYKKRKGIIYTANIRLFRNKVVGKEEIRQILSSYDAIFPVSREFRYPVFEHFRRYHDIENLNLIESILREKSPEMLMAYQEVMKGNKLYSNNMFILPGALHDELMDWLFTIIFEFEKRVDLSSFVAYQERVIGFLSERLITVWAKHKELHIKELKVIYFKKLKFA